VILSADRWFACGSVATVAEDRRRRVTRSEDRRRNTESTPSETMQIVNQLDVSHTDAPPDASKFETGRAKAIRLARVRSARSISIRNTRC
jgi:hypothetical protein